MTKTKPQFVPRSEAYFLVEREILQPFINHLNQNHISVQPAQDFGDDRSFILALMGREELSLAEANAVIASFQAPQP